MSCSRTPSCPRGLGTLGQALKGTDLRTGRCRSPLPPARRRTRARPVRARARVITLGDDRGRGRGRPTRLCGELSIGGAVSTATSASASTVEHLGHLLGLEQVERPGTEDRQRGRRMRNRSSVIRSTRIGRPRRMPLSGEASPESPKLLQVSLVSVVDQGDSPPLSQGAGEVEGEPASRAATVGVEDEDALRPSVAVRELDLRGEEAVCNRSFRSRDRPRPRTVGSWTRPRSVDRAENGHRSERGQFLLVPDYGRETVHDHGETERAEKARDGGQQDDQLPRRTDPFAGGVALDDSQLSRRRCRDALLLSSTRRARRRQRLRSGGTSAVAISNADRSRRVTSLAVTSSICS